MAERSTVEKKPLNTSENNVSDEQLKVLLNAMEAVRNGNLAFHLNDDTEGLFGEISTSYNAMIQTLTSFAGEVTRVAREVGTEGTLGGQAEVEGVSGTWKDLTDNVNLMASNLTSQVRNIAEVATAVAQGDLSQKITVEVKGEILELKNTLNTMVDQLNGFAGEVTRVAREVGTEGTLGGQAEVEGVSGTWKELTDNVNLMASNLTSQVRNIAEVTGAVADGDLTKKITVEAHGEIAELKTTINKMGDDLTDKMRNIAEATAALTSFADELDQVSSEMTKEASNTSTQATESSAAAEQVDRNVQMVATSTEELNASIKEVARNTNEAASVGSKAVDTTEKTNTTIAKLGQSSTEIGNVIKVITSIAEQTNLLALNATIEAARAGEAGKGFAVVANEVKELAKETAKATEDISSKIEAIQTDTKGSVNAIGEISNIINQINEIQNNIAGAVEEQSVTTNEIGRSAGEAAKGTSAIVDNISHVAEAAERTTKGASTAQKAAAELSGVSEQLQDLVNQFSFEGKAEALALVQVKKYPNKKE
jgi:methyl-accepting chemotaxis protein